MKTTTTAKGNAIRIDDNGIAVIIPSSGKNAGMAYRLDNANGKRSRYTNLNGNTLYAYTPTGGCVGRVGIAEIRAWLEENWPVQLTAEEKWMALKPAGVDEMLSYNDAWSAYHREQNRRFDDESLSSITVAAPKIAKPELSQEARAWLYLDGARYSSHYAHAGAAKRAIAKVVDGELTLHEAAEAAEAEWDNYCETYTD